MSEREDLEMWPTARVISKAAQTSQMSPDLRGGRGLLVGFLPGQTRKEALELREVEVS